MSGRAAREARAQKPAWRAKAGKRARIQARKQLEIDAKAAAIFACKASDMLARQAAEFRRGLGRDRFDQVHVEHDYTRDGRRKQHITIGLVPAVRERELVFDIPIPGGYAVAHALKFEARQFGYSPNELMTVRWWNWRCVSAEGRGTNRVVIDMLRHVMTTMEGSRGMPLAMVADHVVSVLKDACQELETAGGG